MKKRLRYEKRGMVRFISHLDTMRVFERALRRIGAPVAFSEGFNPHMLMSLSNPLPLGVESVAEFLDIGMTMEIDFEKFIEDFNSELPLGLKILSEYDSSIVINDVTKWSVYEIFFKSDLSEDMINKGIQEFLNQDSIIIDKKKKINGKKTLTKQEIRNMIWSVNIKEYSDKGVVIETILSTTGQGGLNILKFVKIFNDFSQISQDFREARALRTDILDGNYRSLL